MAEPPYWFLNLHKKTYHSGEIQVEVSEAANSNQDSKFKKKYKKHTKSCGEWQKCTPPLKI